MSTTQAQSTRDTTTRPPGSRPMALLYGVLAVVGLVGTWYYNLQFDGAGGQTYFGAWFANPASSSAAADVIVAALVACVFYVREGLRLRWRWSLALVPLTFLVALAFTFPLFLAMRELRLGAARPGDHAAARSRSAGI